MERLDSFIQTIHCDTFKQAWTADPGIVKVFNSIFYYVLLKCLRTCKHICVEDMIKWLILFCISSPLIWAPGLGAQTGIPASERLCIYHCWVLCLHSKNFCLYVFITIKSLNFFWNVFNSKTFKVSKIYYICPILHFIRYIISKINSIESSFILIILLYFKISWRIRRY